MRITKSADERRGEILNAASALFSQKGFDDTSVNDILESVGIAKGTFYYHFKSKEELLDALIERHGARLLAAARSVAQDASLPVHDKIFRSLRALNMRGQEGDELLLQMHKPQNALMHEKSLTALITGVTPILAPIVREGIAQGLFHTDFPEECVEMIITYVQVAFDEAILPASPEAQAKKMRALIENVARLLGAEKNAFAYISGLMNGEEHDG